MTSIALLGPQVPRSNLREAMDRLDIDSPVAVITAGWRAGEGQIEEMQAAIGRDCVDLQLYHRAEKVMLSDPALHEAYRARQEKLKELQRLYRIRLGPAVSAARALLEAEGDKELIRLETRAAISQLRALDRHHLGLIGSLHRGFDAIQQPLANASLSAERHAIREALAACRGVLIAGGHVAVLMNRLRLFALRNWLMEKPTVAWSAGAMALSDRIVLYHDYTPQGPVTEEVLDLGLGLVPDIVPLPNAARRLDWSDPRRIALFSRRFAPATAVTLDQDSLLRLEDGEITGAAGVQRLERTGRRREVVPK